MNGQYVPGCPRCEWQGEPSPDQLVAFRRAGDHMTQAHPWAHRAEPRDGSEVYPPDWADPADVPDYIAAVCTHCGEPIEWDPRNLWSHV